MVSTDCCLQSQDYSTLAWEILGKLNIARHHHQSAYIGSNKILVMGGYTGSGPAILSGNQTNTTEIIDVVTGQVTEGPPMSVARVAFTCNTLPNGDLIVVGGSSRATEVERFSVSAMSWSVIGHLRSARWQHAAAWISDTELLVVAGYGNESAEIFNIATGTSTLVKNFVNVANSVRPLHPKGRHPTFWGYRTGGPGSSRQSVSHRYDRPTNNWLEDIDFGVSVALPVTLTLQNGDAYAVGGALSEAPFRCSSEAFTLLPDGTLTKLAPSLEGRQHHGAIEFDTNIVLVVGGVGDGVQYLNSTEFHFIQQNRVHVGPPMNVAHVTAQIVPVVVNGYTAAVVISGIDGRGNTPIVEILRRDCATASGKIVPNDFTLRGHSFQRADSIVLTPSETFTRGAAWLKKKVVLSSGLDIQFGFRLNGGADNDLKDGGPEGADGIALVLQNRDPQPLGETGRGIGYDMTPHGIAVEFDAYMNGAFADPSPSHVAVQGGDGTRLRGVHEAPYLRAVAHQGVPNFVANGQEYHARILYDNGLLQVWVDTTSSFNNPVISIPLNLSSEVGTDGSGTAWLGFTSATGFAQQEHVLTYVSLNSCEALVTHVQEFTPNVSLHVVPQPAHTEVILQFGRALPEGAELSVYDVTGTLVLREDVGNMFSKAVHVQHLPSGTYGFQITALHSIMSASTFTVMR